MGNPFSSPSTDAGRTEDREESGLWPFASHDDSDRRSTADTYSDASSSASELPGFPRISDDNDTGGRRSPAGLSSVSLTWGSKSPAFCLYRTLTYLIRVHERNRQTDRQDYYGNTALSCTSVTLIVVL